MARKPIFDTSVFPDYAVRIAVIHDGFVVTHDTDDFQIIQKVMPNLKIMSADEFFNG